jgi:hypothetical protein
MEGKGGSNSPCALSLPLHPSTAAGCTPARVFVTADEALRCRAASTPIPCENEAAKLSKP